MFHPLDPLLTFSDLSPDLSDREITEECDRLMARQIAIDKLLAGHISTDELLDLLSDQHYDVDRYIDLATQNLERAVHQEMPIDIETARLYLPN